MGMISFFKTPKPRQFNYAPIFYDARKEALKEREQLIKQELGISDKDVPRVSLIKGRMRGYYKRTAQDKAKSSLRLIVIMVILLLIAYFLFYY